MNFPKKHWIISLLIFIILLSTFFILRETLFKSTLTEVTQYIPPAQTQTAAVSDFNGNLILHYTFDDGTATDTSGKGNTGTVTGGTATTGKIGGGLEMTSGSSISTSLMTTMPAQGLTFSAWVKTTSSANQVLFKKGSGYGAMDFSYVFGNRLYFQRDGATDLAVRTNSSVTLAPDTWYHIAMTWDGSSTATDVHIYVNGADKPHDINGNGASPNSNSSPLIIFPQWLGTIDDVRVYDRPLTASEIQELYTAAGGTPPPTVTTCSSFTYSSWGTCSNGTQSRTVLTSNPSGCTGGSPVTTQSCTAEPPPDAPTTVTATSCEADAVQAAITAVKDQGTVLVPEGTCTWTKSVTVAGKSLILKGAGIDKTVIIENLSASGHSLAVSVASGKNVRVTGFTFEGSKTKDNYASVSVSGPPGQPLFRVDNNKFLNVTERGVITYGGYGVIDHNTFIRKPDCCSPTLISVFGDGDASWNRPQDMGTSNAVFIEDNTFIHNINANGPFDMYRGARYVFRRNMVYGNNLGHHGFDSDIRGEVNFEVYDNTFVNASPTGEPYKHGVVFEFRSGSGVVFNNTVKRAPTATSENGYYDSFAILRNYRSGDGYLSNYGFLIPWDGKNPWNGVCNGTNALDGNIPGLRGYPCKDQIGRTAGFGSDGKQTYSPIYSWNNTVEKGRAGGPATVGGHLVINGYATFLCPKVGSILVSKVDKPAPGTPYSWVCRNTTTGVESTLTDQFNLHIVEGRDYFNGIPRPDYTPYTYPHPLAVSGFTSDAGGPIIDVPLGTPAPAIPLPDSLIIPPITPPSTSPDFNKDGLVNSLDLSLLLSVWGLANTTYDLDSNGSINTLDYTILVQNWSR